MMTGKHIRKSVIAAIVVTTAAGAKSPCDQANAAREAEPRPEAQLTHMEINIFELRGPAELLMQVDPAMFEDHTKAERAILDSVAILARLRELGHASLAGRLDTQVNIRQQNRTQEKQQIPVRSVSGPRTRHFMANMEWSVSYEGSWGGKNGLEAEIDYRLDYEGVWPEEPAEEGGSQIREYSWSMTQSVVQASGIPVVLVKYRQDTVDGSEAMVTVLRLQATRLDDRGRPMAVAPPPDQLHLAFVIYELSGSRKKLEALDADALAATTQDAADMKKVLGNLGTVETLSRPNIMVNEGQTANITVGEKIPVVRSMDEESGKPEIAYEDVGLSLDVRGVWLDSVRNRVRLNIDLKHSSLGSTGVKVGTGVTLPTITKRAMNRVFDLADGRTGWIIGEPQGNDDTASRLIVGITLAQILTSGNASTGESNDASSALVMETLPMGR